MHGWRAWLAGITSSLLLLSGAAHTVAGWAALRGELAATNAPPDLVQALRAGWVFGGAAMLAFGLLIAHHLRVSRRAAERGRAPLVIIALAYLGFGAWALAASRFDPFFLVFVVPGVLLLLACLPERVSGR